MELPGVIGPNRSARVHSSAARLTSIGIAKRYLSAFMAGIGALVAQWRIRPARPRGNGPGPAPAQVASFADLDAPILTIFDPLTCLSTLGWESGPIDALCAHNCPGEKEQTVSVSLRCPYAARHLPVS